MFHNPTKNFMEKQTEIEESVRCLNCGVIYTLKSGCPEMCWICGMPTEEQINGI
jgi:hypothetical protein